MQVYPLLLRSSFEAGSKNRRAPSGKKLLRLIRAEEYGENYSSCILEIPRSGEEPTEHLSGRT